MARSAVDYISSYRIHETQKLIANYNDLTMSSYDFHFLNEVITIISDSSALSELIGVSEQPNWRGAFTLFNKKREDLPVDFRVAQKYTSLYNRAKDKDLPFNLTFADVKRLLNTKKCKYFDVYLTDEEPGASTHRTIDRIDNTKGYTKDNVVVCSLQANQLKSHLFENSRSVVNITPQQLNKFLKNLSKLA